MINREELIRRHNPVIRKIETDSPLTVGNGELAFTADVTGMQSLYQLYHEKHMPLCTMAGWGWHREPVAGRPLGYTLEDVEMTVYNYENRTIELPIDQKEGSEEAYQWLRQNPHRPNLARIGLTVNGMEIQPEQLTDIHQELHLYEGRLESRFKIDEKACVVTTICHQESDILGFHIETEHEHLGVQISFPYGSHEMSGSDWDAAKNEKHLTTIKKDSGRCIIFEHRMNESVCEIVLHSLNAINCQQIGEHKFELSSKYLDWGLSFQFSKQNPDVFKKYDAIHFKCYRDVLKNTQMSWKAFWRNVGIVDFSGSTDPRAKELERRIILSIYLLTIQSSGSLPPQETGLTCNSWHGKFHLEMHLWHGAWLPLWNQGALLEKSLPWYYEILKKAIYNAGKNGFKGARWPKQVANDGIDSPSPIAPLLIWQQSHLIYMLELLRKQDRSEAWMKQHWELIKQSADFMCDYLSWNEAEGCYELVAPIIPAQEEHDPRIVKNPTFELEYWRFSLQIAIKWAKILEEPCEGWKEVVGKMAEAPRKAGLYLAHEHCPDTFELFNRDHPSMLGAFGLISSERLDIKSLENTLNKVLSCWQFETMWGWDFAMMAMTAVRLGKPALAMDILMMDSPKNEYVISGNNYQRLRSDLPLYLPGNGSLLLAVALMVAGFEGCADKQPGIPKNGDWQAVFENINQFPY